MSTHRAPEVTRAARVSHTTFLRLRLRVGVVGDAGTGHGNRRPYGRMRPRAGGPCGWEASPVGPLSSAAGQCEGLGAALPADCHEGLEAECAVFSLDEKRQI